MKATQTRNLAMLATLAAVCLAIQLAPRPPNVEFTSFLVFLVGAYFGVAFGSLLGSSIMFVNGILSPWGFSGFMLPFQIAGMLIVGVAGGLYGKTKQGIYTVASSIEVAVLGAFLTLLYDLITNFGVALSNMMLGLPPVLAIASAAIAGVPFLIIHVSSNFLVFLVAFFPLSKALTGFLGGESLWRKVSVHM